MSSRSTCSHDRIGTHQRRRAMSGAVQQICVVTGAASGIGKEIAIDLARRGSRVIVIARDAARVSAAVDDVKRRGGSVAVEVIACDLSSIASIKACAADLVKRYPKIDLL